MKGVTRFNGAASSGSTSAADVVVVEKDYVGLSEAASSHPAAEDEDAEARDEREEEEYLELGLSLGANKVAGGGGGKATAAVAAPWGRCRIILTAKDFPSLVPRASPRSSSTSSVSSPSAALGGGVSGGGGVAGTKRAADSVSPDVVESGQPPSQVVVGWPPIRAFRMNSLFNQSKDNTSQTDANVPKKTNSNNTSMKEAKGNNDQARNGRAAVSSRFVKVNMDGDPIGRKVDLNAHRSYETLALSLELMFHKPAMALNTSARKTALMQSICTCKIKAEVMSSCFGNIGMDGNMTSSKWMMADGVKASKLLDGSSEFALTYEDRDGDWMLVGDVPWGMFLDTVKRLRIMRTSDASGLGSNPPTNLVG